MDKSIVSIYIAGDSTAADKKQEEKPMSGWGEFIGKHFDASVVIKNHAVNGRSTKSFVEQNLLDNILTEIKTGDILLIQFGHNDQKKDDPERFTEPGTEYKENLVLFIDEAHKRGAYPILLTSISRRQFVKGQLNKNSLGDYPEAMRDVARELQVPLIDMNKLTSDYLAVLGEEQSKNMFLHLKAGEYDNYPNGLTDDTHFSEGGAKTIAKMTAEELVRTVDRLRPYTAVKEKGKIQL